MSEQTGESTPISRQIVPIQVSDSAEGSLPTGQNRNTQLTELNTPTPAPEDEHVHPIWVIGFLEAMRRMPNVTAACKLLGIDRTTPYRYRETNKDFESAWKDAESEGCDTLEAAAWHRAVDGTPRPIYQGGEKVGEETVYSDSLMITLLKAHKPNKYRERVSAEIKGEVEIFGSIMHTLTDEELVERAFILTKEARALGNYSGTRTPPVDHSLEE